MIIYPAIDIVGGKAVRLLRGDYDKMTVYSDDPSEIAMDLVSKGATHIHIVDLEAAKTGETPNMETVIRIKERAGVFCEIGGGIRSMETAERYLENGLDRVILGTAALEDRTFLKQAVRRFGPKIAVGVDLKDGMVAVKGWTVKSDIHAIDFIRELEEIGVDTVIVTDISKDGAMQGTNREMYRAISRMFSTKLVASGGVSSLDDVLSLKKMGLHGAIIGKAYYTGAIDLKEVISLSME